MTADTGRADTAGHAGADSHQVALGEADDSFAHSGDPSRELVTGDGGAGVPAVGMGRIDREEARAVNELANVGATDADGGDPHLDLARSRVRDR